MRIDPDHVTREIVAFHERKVARMELARTIALVLCAAVLVVLALSFEVATRLQEIMSFGIGFLGLCLLMAAVAIAPFRAMCLWGAFYVPFSGLWLAPALGTGPDVVIGFVLLSAAGVIFYGGVSGVLLKVWEVLAVKAALPALARSLGMGLVLGVSIWLAEHAAASADLVIAPVGLLAVHGGPAWIIAEFGVFAANGVLVVLAALVVTSWSSRPSLAFGIVVAVALLASAPGPDQPQAPDISIVGVAHNPIALDLLVKLDRRPGFEEFISGVYYAEPKKILLDLFLCEAIDLPQLFVGLLGFGTPRHKLNRTPVEEEFLLTRSIL